MKFYAINGSPRKAGNTVQVLKKVESGFYDEVHEKFPNEKIELNFINLYSLNYTSCRSCFSCKRLNGKSYGHCIINDDLKEIFRDLETADAMVLGSPIYLMDVSGEMKSFIDRLIFQYLVYDENNSSLAENKLPTACVYTMNIKKEDYDKFSLPYTLNNLESFISNIFSKVYSLKVFDTYQFKDYSKFKNSIFDEEEKLQQKLNQFPKDLDEAYNLGRKLAKDAINNL
ncbi:flavodoxin [Methanobrevibacter sp. 87.7]|uniref:flavodoxin family protein n=1 Tax=Methanobrevibacter sp. 87.7 TaxID=387957 RepID=UPI000B5030F1|nr:flavodoxin family protein [Methanobrevibacter sp. 87.7]OWT32580.1 flavodoxin [Methanobrevibacter sp. 87.7]